MPEISAQLVKELRERTGAGMMECKKALQQANGDIEAAVVVLRKRGIGGAEKKAGRSTKQGLIASRLSDGGNLGVLVEVNCESDFVARTDDFQSLAADVAEHVAEHKPKYVNAEQATEAERISFKEHEALYQQKFSKDQSSTVGELVKSKIAKLGENINVSRFVVYEAGANSTIGEYVHTGAQIGVLVEVEAKNTASFAREEFKTLLRDIAMQIAAVHPQYVSKSDVPADVLEKERAIQRERVLNEGKPEKMVDKIAEGRMGKFYEDICLLEQPFIRENSISVSELIKTVAAKLNDTITVKRFVRYKVGDAGDVAGVEQSPLPVTA